MAFWSPKQLYYMWQWKVEIFARNWGWSFKHETSTSHLGRGQLREAQIFFPTMVTSLVTSLVTWPRVWSGASALKRRLETWKVWNSIFVTDKFRKWIEQPDRFTLKSFSWSCNMKSYERESNKNPWKSMNSENSDLTCVLISLFQFRSVAPLRVNCSMTEATWILRKSISNFHTMCQCLLLFD